MSSDREQKGKRYLTALFLAAALLCAGLLCAWLWEPENRLQQAEASAGGSGNRTVLLGGMPVGIYMETDGVMVLSTESLEGVDGEEHEPAAGIVRRPSGLPRSVRTSTPSPYKAPPGRSFRP